MDQQTEALQARTNAKLRYAKVHLDELAGLPMYSGTDFDRAHQESFLFHLFGTRDVFLMELHHYYGLAPIEKLTPGNLHNALNLKGIKSNELSAIFTLDQDDNSWYKLVKDMRDQSMHNQGLSHAFFMGGQDDGKVKLKNPTTGVLIDGHFIDEFQDAFEKMRNLIDTLRKSAVEYMVSNNSSKND